MPVKRLRAYLNGSLLYEELDTFAITGGTAGFSSAHADDVIDDFECGDFVGALRSLVFSDDFNRTDEILDASAEWVITEGDWQVVSNEAKATIDGSLAVYTESSGALDDDATYAAMTVTAWGDAGSQPFLCLNVIDSTPGAYFDEQYFWGWDRESSRWFLGRVTGGVQTNFVAELGAGAPSLPYTLELEIIDVPLRPRVKHLSRGDAPARVVKHGSRSSAPARVVTYQ